MFDALTPLPPRDTKGLCGEAVMVPKSLRTSQTWQDLMTGSGSVSLVCWEKYLFLVSVSLSLTRRCFVRFLLSPDNK